MMLKDGGITKVGNLHMIIYSFYLHSAPSGQVLYWERFVHFHS